jgi:putative endonuclease
LAESTLVREGMHILARRYRTRLGEIDLVAEDGTVIVFVEVKTRRSTLHGFPAEAVGARKRRRIAAAALAYLKAHDLFDRSCRFDVIEVLEDRTKGWEVRCIRDAFRLESRR